MLRNYKNINTLMNMIMCISILSISHFYPSDMNTMTIATYPLFIYCIVDIPYNRWDMVLHHSFTLILGLTLSFDYVGKNEDLTLMVSKTFIDTEISTIFLNMLYLGYNQALIRISFITTFFYYRIICILFLLFINPSTCYFCNQSDFVCGNDISCNKLWIISTIGLSSLNIFWFVKILKNLKLQ